MREGVAGKGGRTSRRYGPTNSMTHWHNDMISENTKYWVLVNSEKQ